VRREFSQPIHLSHLLHQLEQGHEKQLRIHPEALTELDISCIRKLCNIREIDFCLEAKLDIYQHTDFYMQLVKDTAMNHDVRNKLLSMLQKLELARNYETYKWKNDLIDFEDLLIITYEATAKEDAMHKRYHWIQVDEVQDLNALQMAIIDNLTAKENAIVVYLGDQQQAIFSFMGAKTSTLDQIVTKCAGNIHHLSTNHRSPAYLLEVFNTYAHNILKIDEQLLPKAKDNEQKPDNQALGLLESGTVEDEISDVAKLCQQLYEAHEEESTAVVVSSNIDADSISEELKRLQLPHFKISGDDVFSSAAMHLLLAHISLISNEQNFIAWTHVLRGLKVTVSNAFAQNFMRSLLNRAMLPSDLLEYEHSTYIQEFANASDNKTLVVFDTETTGLDVYNDDIIQIAAQKIHQGKVVEDSQFSIFIKTEKEVPEMLGSIENPIVKALKENKLLAPDEALSTFIDYAKDCVLIGHNSNYDYQILKHNLIRYLPSATIEDIFPTYFDTLKLARLLFPKQKEYRLEHLIEALHLEGTNSHLADEDVGATVSLVGKCKEKANEIIPLQQAFLSETRVQERAHVLRQRYRDVWCAAQRHAYDLSTTPQELPLITEIQKLHGYFVADGLIEEVEKLPIILRYIKENIIGEESTQSLHQQAIAHAKELCTLKEADLCSSLSKHYIFVSTVHKAKGLEFDNVIVFDAVDGRFPNYFNHGNARMTAEDARRFYVAITRAKRRLIIACSTLLRNRRGEIWQRKQLTPFMRPIVKFFQNIN